MSGSAGDLASEAEDELASEALADEGEALGPDDLAEPTPELLEDFGLLVDADESEEVGLDTETGVDDPEDSLFTLADDLGGPAGEEEEKLSAAELYDLDDEPEYGWTGEDESGTDDEWDEIALSDFSDPPSGADRAEGDAPADEEHGEMPGVIGDDDVSHLPTLHGGEEEDFEDLDLGPSFLPSMEIDPILPPELAPEGRLITEVEVGGPVVALADPCPRVFWSEGLCSADSSGKREPLAGPDGFGPGRVCSLAAHERWEEFVALSTDVGDVWISGDGGRSFKLALRPCTDRDGIFLCLEARRAEPRLWARSESGALYRSDDRAQTWVGPLLLSPVAAVCAPTSGGLLALCAGTEAPCQLARTGDGGIRWAATLGPSLPIVDVGAASASDALTSAERLPTDTRAPYFLAAWEDQIAVGCADRGTGPYYSADGGRTYVQLPLAQGAGPVAVVSESNGVSVYAIHAGLASAALVRHRPAGGESAVVLEVALPAGKDGSALRFVAATSEGGETVVWTAGDAGLWRIVVRPERVE